ncbi:hypothetical protein B0H16DRAFT_1780867 [Mycena metata]|uniref:SWIM-type domain-containing protein n=1 Tax=Mycena metata TaxID=1033252 RepID=A0AAD7JRT2_9AGAR|nr:hypothetical protein B0H16DRAFT_1780867 [Mycena metata]
MAQHGLDLDAHENLSNRWSQQWSSNSSKSEPTRRVLYHCECGYDHTWNESKARHTPLPFTGCLAHAEVTYVVLSQKNLRIRGYFQHNQGCKDALFTCIPPIPVHPSVFAVALAQLRDGATFTNVKNKNRELLSARNYHGFPADIRNSPYRWLIETRDSRSLFRQHNRLNGVKITEKPQINIDEWLDPSSPEYNPIIADAIFHYSARASKGERFESCIATDEMRETAWKYGHENQIILDGTFRDENRKGIPVAFLLFSAPTGNKQSSAGYNTAILTKLLRAWKDSLTRCAHLYGFEGIVFSPFSAITDTDLKERGALIAVWITIWLLICRFHLRQSWKNYHNKLLKGKGQLKLDLKHRLKRLEDSLVETETIAEARGILTAEMKTLLLLPDSKPVRKTLKHIKYLSEYWTTDNLWQSWSNYGRKVAAALLGCCHMDGVIPTTNHLESFNGVLKRKHLRQWQNGGRRLRVDVLIRILIIHILPSIFKERRLLREQSLRLAAQIRRLPGGESLVRSHASKPTTPRIAYLLGNDARQQRATDLVNLRQIGMPTFLLDGSGLSFTCYSSEALEVESQPLQYTITILFTGVATCNCTDFRKHGGACKHLRAALIILDHLRSQKFQIPAIPIPQSLADTHTLETQTSPPLEPTASPEETLQLPTVRAAAVVTDLLGSNESCHDTEEKADESDSDNESVDTDASSDSDDSDDDDPDDAQETALQGPQSPPQNQRALGEQALARALFELEEMDQKFRDLTEYLKHNPGPLSDSSTELLARRAEPVAAFMTEITPSPPLFPSSAPPRTQVANGSNKRKAHLLPPSPEKASKRHQSFAPH